MRHTLISFALMILLGLLAASCHKKDLCPECEQEQGVEIKFDWSEVTVIPDEMTVLFYSMSGTLEYTFDDVKPDGELIRINSGEYKVACFNTDSNYSGWEGLDNYDSLKVSLLNTGGVDISSVVSTRAVATADDGLTGATLSSVLIKPFDQSLQIVLLTPATIPDHYTYILNDVVNSQYITRVEASLSGLSKTYYMNHPDNSGDAVTTTFGNNQVNVGSSLLTGDMYNLGYDHDPTQINYLVVYIWSPGGNLRLTFNVTDQIRDASNPKDVKIVINNRITIPSPIVVDPSVEEWKDLYFDVII